MSNHPFIKANYPHHEGIWGWGNAADQVVLMIRNIRRSMVECECIQINHCFTYCFYTETMTLMILFNQIRLQTMTFFGILKVS